MPLAQLGALATVLLLLLSAATSRARPLPGFDCAKAASPVERTICSDDELARLDHSLMERYEALSRSVSPEGLAVLRAGQRRWLESRRACVTKEASHDQAVSCLSGLYSERIDDLDGQYRSVGSRSIENRESERTLKRQRVEEFDSHPWMVGPTRQIEAFNRFVTQRLKLGGDLFTASGMTLERRPQGDTTFRRSYAIHRFDARLLSIEIFQSHESYVGHGWRAEYAINWDVQADRPLRATALFSPEHDWQGALYEQAMRQLREPGDIQDPESWFGKDALDDDDAWLFDEDGAVLLLGHGERSMVGASADVAMPYAVLQPFLRPDAPITAAPR